MKLFTPENIEIVGILLEDQSVSEFEFNGSRENGETTLMYTLPNGNKSKLATDQSEMILIDENGKRWLASDIEFHNAGNFQNR